MQKIVRSAAAIAWLLLLASCTGERYHVEGNITDAKDSILYFENMSLDGPQVVDSVKLDDSGAFSFTGDRPEAPDFFRLRIAGSIINICVDSIETITVKASYPTMVRQYEVSGNDDCQRIKELSLMQQDLMDRVVAVDHIQSLGVEQFADSVKAMVAKYKDYVRKNYIYKEPQKPSSYFALLQSLGSNLIFNPQASEEDARTFAAVATSWDTFYPGAERGKNLHNIAIEGIKTQRIRAQKSHGLSVDASKVKVENIIDIPLVDNKGNRRSLKELIGKVVILDFHLFASEGSTARIMQMRDLYDKYHSRGLEIYQVGLDADEHFWKTQTAALPWISVHEGDGPYSPYLSLYNVQSIPCFFVIDRTNTIYKRDSQIKDLNKELEGLLR